jgi:hypothetical protein
VVFIFNNNEFNSIKSMEGYVMKYLVNFEIVKQGFSEIVDAKDKQEALEKAKLYLGTRFTELKSIDTVTEIHEGRS